MGKARKPPVPRPPPEPCCRSGEVRVYLCVDGVSISRWECIGEQWVQTGVECPEIPRPPCTFCCNLLEAVVFLNRCLTFWLGRCARWIGATPEKGLPPTEEYVGPPPPPPPPPPPIKPICPFPEVDRSKPHKCYRGVLIGLYWSDLVKRSVWTRSSCCFVSMFDELGCCVCGFDTLEQAQNYTNALIELGTIYEQC